MTVRWLAWAGFGLWAALTVVGFVFHLAAGDVQDAIFALALGALAWSGALLCVRRPENPIGRVLLALALLLGVSLATEGLYVALGDETDPSLATRLLVWVQDVSAPVWFGLVLLLPMLFPSGHLPSPRWRPLLWAGVAVVIGSVLEAGFGRARLDWGAHGGARNPLAIAGPLPDILHALAPVAIVVFAVIVVSSLASILLRLRRAVGAERQQLKWFAWSIALMIGALVVGAAGGAVGSDLILNVGFGFYYATVFVAMPLAIAVAILRYRLYDIDLVIRRTLVYGALTLALGATYFGLVLLIGLTIGRSNLAIAVSTLAVAALFRPLRAGIQGAVDQRFYRRRYDAARTLEAFGVRLRDELDLEALATDVRRVVCETVQPEHVSLWLRSGR